MVVTRRRSAAMAADRPQLAGEAPTEATSSPGKPSRRKIARKSTTKSVNVVKEKVVTESFTRQQTVNRVSPPGRSLADEVDPWEVLPKTGYTYAKSPSYSQKYLGQDWEIPNMSRPRLRSGLSSSMTLSSSETCSIGETLSFSRLSSHSQQQLVQNESHQESYSSSASWRKSRNVDINEKEQSEEIADQVQRLPPSMTRSGRRHYGSHKDSQSVSYSASRDTGVSSMTVEEYMQLEKDMEYSGQSVPYKESPRLSLFGLDQADECDVSDTETDHHVALVTNSSQSQTASSSYLWLLITTIITIITRTVTTSWKVATTPLWWFVDIAEAVFGSTHLGTESTNTKSQHIIYDEYIKNSHASDIKESHMNSLIREQIEYVQDNYDYVDQCSDEEFSDLNEKHLHKSVYELAEERSGDEDSWCCQICYVMIAVAYLLFIALPTGMFKVIKTCSVWLMSCVLLPVVDGARSVAVTGYTAVASSISHSRVSSTSGSAGVVKDSGITVALSGASGLSWHRAMVCYGSKAWAALCTAAQMLAAILWIQVEAIINVFCYGLCRNWCWRLGTWIHELAANVLLLDVWIHSRSRERRSFCCLLPLLLLLIPLFLLPVSHDWLAAVVKEKSHTNILIGDKIEARQSAGVSVEALREIIDQELSATKADLKIYSSGLYKENLQHIQKLEEQLKDQSVLLAQLKDCCKDDKVLAGLIRSGVQEQLSLLMFGAESDSGADSYKGDSSYGLRSGQLSNTAFVHWLESQFTKSADFDARIAALTETMNQKFKEQSQANKAALLAATQANQAAEQAKSESERAAKIAASLEESQEKQARMWSKDKASLETLIGNVAADLKKTDKDAAAAAAEAAAANKAAIEAGKTAAAMKSTQSLGQNCGSDINIGMGCGSTNPVAVEPGNYQTVTEEQVKLLIKEALGIFGADKTGMVDYALESAGGSVISTRCSETYRRRTAQLSLFGFPLWYVSNSPRTVIQPDVQPGQCWAFKGTQGYIVIQLAGWVKPTSFSLEHIPKSLSPTGRIDSAPKEFTVWGLKFERDTDGQLLGNYTYLDNGEPLQFFQVQKSNVGAFHIVELRIHSNHGNQEYTCLYRFRVHGVLTKI